MKEITTHARRWCGALATMLLVATTGARLLHVAPVSARAASVSPSGVNGTAALAPSTARVVVLDVGQGQAVLAADGAEGVLLDAGPPRIDVARMVRRAGVTRLDGIVLTHDARDHIGGLLPVATALRPDWIGEPAMGPDRRVAEQLGFDHVAKLCAGSRATVGAITLDVVNPPCEHPGYGDGSDVHNDSALAVVVSAHGRRVFVPSDAETSAIAPDGRFDAVVVAHHGSADAGLATWLAHAQPPIAAISVGAHNMYGHPAPSTVATLIAAGVETHTTERDGTITMRIAPAGVTIDGPSPLPWWCGSWLSGAGRCERRS